MKKDSGTPRMVEQLGLSTIQKEKAVVEQRTLVAEQQLRMVSMIASPAIVSAEKEEKSRQEKRTE